MGVIVSQPGAQVIYLDSTRAGATIIQSPPSQFVQINQASPLVESSRVLGPPPRGLGALGWRFFQDSQYQTTPLYCPAATRTQIPDNAKGMLMQAGGVASQQWMKLVNGRLFADAIDDVFIYRLNLTMSPTINNKTVLFDFDQGTPNKIWNRRVTLSTGAGVPVPDSYNPVVSCKAPMVINGGAFFVTPDCDLFISKISILAVKTFSADPLS